jgi:hypothetical protein
MGEDRKKAVCRTLLDILVTLVTLKLNNFYCQQIFQITVATGEVN